MPVVSAEPEYETVERPRQTRHARVLRLSGKTMSLVKGAAKIGLVTFGVLLLAAAWSRRSGSTRKVRGAEIDEVSQDFQVHSTADCVGMMKYLGCEKKLWSCLAKDNDFTPEYTCCCDQNYWHVPQQQVWRPPAAAIRHFGVSVLRLQKKDNICLAGPEVFGSHFTLARCEDSNARFKLPPRGAGPIELASQPGMCLGVVKGSLKQLEVTNCNHGSMEQMFQLTNGDKGMLQWSHGGNKCLDSENDSTESGSKIMLADCVYWPLKPSQVFVLEEAPKKEADSGEKKEEKKKELPHPSLFCTSIMLPWSYEVDMIKSHARRGCGIFNCTGWAVYSSERIKLKDGATEDEDLYNDVMEGSLKAKVGGKFHTALNTPVFVRFWKKLIADGKVWDYDWVIKVDPDAVFFPDRLTEMLKSLYQPHGTTERSVWLNNCQLGLHGPIEVFNTKALRSYADGANETCGPVAEEHGQEDVYMSECFQALGVPKVDALNLLLEADWACNERPSSKNHLPPCYDQQVSFHPFKSVESYFKCYDRAVKMSWSLPMTVHSVPPSTANGHHDS